MPTRHVDKACLVEADEDRAKAYDEIRKSYALLKRLDETLAAAAHGSNTKGYLLPTLRHR